MLTLSKPKYRVTWVSRQRTDLDVCPYISVDRAYAHALVAQLTLGWVQKNESHTSNNAIRLTQRGRKHPYYSLHLLVTCSLYVLPNRSQTARPICRAISWLHDLMRTKTQLNRLMHAISKAVAFIGTSDGKIHLLSPSGWFLCLGSSAHLL